MTLLVVTGSSVIAP